MDEMIKKWGGKSYISCSYSCTVSFLMKISLIKLKYLYTQYAWISIRKNKIATKLWRLKRWWNLLKLLTISITSFNFFNCPVKLERNLKLKFRWKFNHGFTNDSYLHSAVWKALYNTKEPRRQDITNFSFKMIKIMRSLRSSV